MDPSPTMPPTRRTRLRATRLDLGEVVRYWMDDECWAELPRLSRDLDERLAAADGWSRVDQLGTGLAAPQQDQLTGLLQLLGSAGLAVEGRPETTLGRVRIGLLGSGALARGVATGLVRAGVRHLVCLDERPPDPMVWPGSRHGTGAAALARSLRPRHGLVVSTSHGVAELLDHGVDLVVVAPGTVGVDRLLLAELVELGLGHLVLGCHGDVGTVGPLVLPGRTPCLQCHDLARAGRDSARGAVLALLGSTPARPHPSMAAAIASRCVLEVGWAARDLARAERLAGVMEVHDLERPGTRELRFRAHPDCGCAWLP